MNLEGKELRFGPTAGATWAVRRLRPATAPSNAMHDSLNPLTGLVPMAGMWLNVVFGGVGVGLINMFLFIDYRRVPGGHDGRPHAGISRRARSKPRK